MCTEQPHLQNLRQGPGWRRDWSGSRGGSKGAVFEKIISSWAGRPSHVRSASPAHSRYQGPGGRCFSRRETQSCLPCVKKGWGLECSQAAGERHLGRVLGLGTAWQSWDRFCNRAERTSMAGVRGLQKRGDEAESEILGFRNLIEERAACTAGDVREGQVGGGVALHSRCQSRCHIQVGRSWEWWPCRSPKTTGATRLLWEKNAGRGGLGERGGSGTQLGFHRSIEEPCVL